MRLTPLDIRKQEFARRVRGVDADEVNAFLQAVSLQWDEILAEQRSLESKVREMETKLQHYIHVEEALQEALRTARESAKQTLETARQKAEGIIGAARQQADEIRRAAEQERGDLRREGAEVQSRRDEIIARLRAFLHSELELLQRFETDRTAPAFAASSWQPVLPPVQTPAIHPVELPVAPAPRTTGPPTPEPHSGDTSSGLHAPSVSPAPSADREETRVGGGWTVKPVMGSGHRPTQPDAQPATEAPAPAHQASEEELERIRQILKDLE